jgi:multiple sugar transport system ATP-binding protein
MAGIALNGVEVRYGQTIALKDVNLDIADGEFFAVLGPPGAGKTTLLRTIVGLETPVAGDVLIDGERVNDVWPGDRDISIVFQNLALYPDKSVYDNLNFPLKQRKVPKPEAKRRIEETAKILRITHLMDRKPGKLSGGERQRVALGRAMVRDPRAYLFDEPLSALDALLRLEMRTELKHMQRDLGRTLVYVTHDQIEAMSMPDRVAVLRDGVIQQVASPEDIYNRPANRFVATVVGSPPMNFLPVTASWDGGALELRHESLRVRTGASVPADLQGQLADGAAAWIGVRPEDIEIVAAGSGAVEAAVYVTEPLGGETVVDLHLAERVVKVLAPANIAVERDQTVGVRLDPRRLHLFDEHGTALISAGGGDAFSVEPARAG